MKLLEFSALCGLAASSVQAFAVPQQALDVAGQALSWTGSAADADQVHANTVWSYVDCGKLLSLKTGH